jgi:surface carbohydrate biosynthesis protein
MAKILLVEQHINRAFNSIVLIGEVLKRRGHQVKISQTGVFFERNVVDFNPDIIYMPWVTKSSTKFFEKVRFSGKIVNAFQEQHLLIDNPNHAHSRQIENTDIFFGWGKEYVKQAKKINDNIDAYEVGSPRYDSYAHHAVRKMFLQSRAELADEYNLSVNKPWVLVAYDYPFLFDEKKTNKLINKGHTNKEYVNSTRKAFERLTIWLQEITDLHSDKEFILRLHPGSNEKRVKEYQELNDKENVTYNNKGSLNQWIVNCDYYLTRLSTSVMEAWIADKPYGLMFPDLLPDNRKDDMHISEAQNLINTFSELDAFLSTKSTKHNSSYIKHKKFLEHKFGKVDGKASLRTAEKLHDLTKDITRNDKVEISFGYYFYLKIATLLKTFLNKKGLISFLPTSRPNTEFISEEEIEKKQKRVSQYLEEYLTEAVCV